VIEGDRSSRRRLGHGNAIAHPFHHVILPLASDREKRREIHWGIDDFERRFGRAPDGMWLPETAVDRSTLDALAAAGLAFTVLAPHQVKDPPPAGNAVTIALDGGRKIAVFTYDGELSHGVAFGALLGDEAAWRERLTAPALSQRHVVTTVTDGETFGHHHRGADRTLMRVVAAVRDSETHRMDNFASCLARHPPAVDVELVEPSSWSCAHGVDRWRGACGCKMAPEIDSQQEWRRPLREALAWLESELDRLVGDGAVHRLSDPARAEVARDIGAMFTSCAWFFDDVGGLEATQSLRYAAHAIDLVARVDRPEAERLDRELTARLGAAPSNDPAIGDAGALYATTVRGAHPLGSLP